MDSGPALLLDAAVAAFSILGGMMAFQSGFLSAGSYWAARPLAEVADRVTEGIAQGFTAGLPGALIVFMITLVG